MNILMLGKNSRCLFNAIRRVLQGKEKATASIVYETIWSWLLKYFDEDKAGVMEAIHKGEYARKLMNPNGKKDISCRDALTLNPSLLCQDGFEEALSYCELDNDDDCRFQRAWDKSQAFFCRERHTARHKRPS